MVAVLSQRGAATARNGIGMMQWRENDKQLTVVTGLRPMPVEEMDEYTWFINNSGDKPQVVATRKPNVFGVYDMPGNVWEWVEDGYGADSYEQARAADPAGPAEGFSKVRRGGSCHCPIHLLRPGYRAANKPGLACQVNGFRVVAEPR